MVTVIQKNFISFDCFKRAISFDVIIVKHTSDINYLHVSSFVVLFEGNNGTCTVKRS